jgi:hypothetical protein
MQKLSEKLNKKTAIGRGRSEGDFSRASLFASRSHRSKTQIAIPPHNQGDCDRLSIGERVYIVLVKLPAARSIVLSSCIADNITVVTRRFHSEPQRGGS